VLHLRDGIRLLQIREREQVNRIQRVEEWMSVTRGLREALIETAAPPTRDVGPDPIQRDVPLLILIESEVEPVAQKSSALREHVRDRTAELLMLFEIRNDIAHRGQSQPGDWRVLGRVDELIQTARVEALSHRDRSAILDLPGGARDRAARRIDV